MIAHDRAIVIGPRCDVPEMSGRQSITGERLEVHDVNDLVGRCDRRRRAAELTRHGRCLVRQHA